MKAFSARFDDDVYSELEEISQMTGQSKNAVLNIIIREKYHTINGDPKVKKAFEQLSELKATFERMSAELKA